MSACTWASTPRCSVRGEQPTSPPSSSGLWPLPELVGGAASRCSEPAGIGLDDRQRLLDERQEVRLQPRHGRELRAVRHLVDRDPQAEVARPERVPLLEGEDVGADVVDGVVGRRARRGRRGRAGRTGRAHAAAMHPSSTPISVPATRRPMGASGLRATRSPTRVGERGEHAAHRRDVGVAPIRAVEHARRRGAGGVQAGEVGDQLLGLGVTAAKSRRSEPPRYDAAIGSRPANRRATRSARSQSTGSGGRGRLGLCHLLTGRPRTWVAAP